MLNKVETAFWFIFICLLVIGSMAHLSAAEKTKTNAKHQPYTSVEYAIRENKGQLTNQYGEPVPQVLFYTNLSSVGVYVTAQGLSYVFREVVKKDVDKGKENQKKQKQINWSRVDLELLGARINSENVVYGVAKKTKRNYYLAHCPDGISNVSAFESVTFKEVYPKIDWVLTISSLGELKYDFILHPGADVNNIKMVYKGGEDFALKTKPNSLLINTPLGTIEEGELFSYYQDSKVPIASSYRAVEDVVQIKLEGEPTNRTIVVDPPLDLKWATYYGEGTASFNGPKDIAADPNNNLFAVGYTNSEDFPTEDPGGDSYYNGTYLASNYHAWIAKFNVGGALLWATYYGGSQEERAQGVACSSNGDVFVVGISQSRDFPGRDPNGGAYYQDDHNGSNFDGFILQFSNDGERKWATQYGGNANDQFWAVDVGPSGDVYVTGQTSSEEDFAVLSSGGNCYYQPDLEDDDDCIILRFDGNGVPKWATYFGGRGDDIPIDLEVTGNDELVVVGRVDNVSHFPLLDPGGNAFFEANYAGGGDDGFVAKFNNDNELIWSTLVGGGQVDIATTVDSRENGNIVVAGTTLSDDLITQSFPSAYQKDNMDGILDGFLMEFSATSQLLWSTYLGGSGQEQIKGVTVRKDNSIYIVGETSTPDLSTIDADFGLYQPDYGGNMTDALFLAFDSSRAMIWSTYYGGEGRDWGIAVAASDTCIYFTGEVTGTSSPATHDPGGGAYYQDVIAGLDNIFFTQICGCQLAEVTLSGDTSICIGEEATLEVEGGVSQVWYNGFSGGNITVTPDQTRYFAVEVTSLLGCLSEDSIRVEVHPLPQAVIEGDTMVCLGDSLLLRGTGGEDYLWENVIVSDTIWVSPIADAFYHLQVASEQGCSSEDSIAVEVQALPVLSLSGDTLICFGDTADLFVEGADNYIWENGRTDEEVWVVPGSTSHVLVEGTSAEGCISVDSIEVEVLPNPVAEIVGDTLLCLGDTVRLAAQGGANYQWSSGATSTLLEDDPQQDQWYWVDVTENICSSRDSIWVSVLLNPVVDLTGPSSICEGEVLNVSASGANTYQWWNGATGNDQQLLLTGDTVLHVIGFVGSCQAEDSLLIAYNALPEIEILGDTMVCEGSSTELIGLGGDRYEWSTTATAEMISVQPAITTTYWLMGWEGACMGRDSIQVSVNTGPHAAFSYSPQGTIEIGDLVEYRDESVGAIVNWSWDYGDGTVGLGSNAQHHRYGRSGSYLVKLAVEDEAGCRDSAEKRLEVIDEQRIYVPNSFTPNGDGVNDVFQIAGVGWENELFQLQVFDRWGGEVFQSPDHDEGWSGHLNSTSELAPQGVYTWRLQYRTSQGKIVDRAGHVTLLR